MYRYLNTGSDSATPPTQPPTVQTVICFAVLIAVFVGGGVALIFLGNENGRNEAFEWILSGAMLVFVGVAIGIYSALKYPIEA